MQQALGYAEMLDVPFVFSSNGDGFLFHDRTGNAAVTSSEAPFARSVPDARGAVARYCVEGASRPPAGARHPGLLLRRSGKAPRYYQVNAINRVVEAVAKGKTASSS
jgi:type I restriction enzyme R subunit